MEKAKSKSKKDPIKHYLLCPHPDCRFLIKSGLKMCDYMAIHQKEHPGEGPHKRPCKGYPECECYESGKRKGVKKF